MSVANDKNMNVTHDWVFKARSIALQDKNWNYYHLGHIKVDDCDIAPIAYSFHNYLYSVVDKHFIPLQIPVVCKTVGKRLERVNNYHKAGKTVTIGLFPSYTSLYMGVHFDGRTKVLKVESLTESIPTLPELECEPFPAGQATYVKNAEIIKDILLARFNF